MFVNRGGQWTCLNCEYSSDRSVSDPGEAVEVEMEEAQEEEVSTGEVADGSKEAAYLMGLQKQLAQMEAMHVGLAQRLLLLLVLAVLVAYVMRVNIAGIAICVKTPPIHVVPKNSFAEDTV